MSSVLKMRVRFDYIGKGKMSKFFSSSKNMEQHAEQARQNKVAMVRNVPIQGIHIEDIDMSLEVYSVYDEISGKQVAYAPVLITFAADSIEDAVNFIISEEFRTIEVLQPEELSLTRYDLERLFYKIGKEFEDYKDFWVRKFNNWK